MKPPLPPNVIGPHILAEFFDHHANANEVVYSQEISTLQANGVTRCWGQLWNDAADEGFVMIGSGNDILFTLSGTDKGSEPGEIAGWRFTAYRATSATRPIRALIIND